MQTRLSKLLICIIFLAIAFAALRGAFQSPFTLDPLQRPFLFYMSALSIVAGALVLYDYVIAFSFYAIGVAFSPFGAFIVGFVIYFGLDS